MSRWRDIGVRLEAVSRIAAARYRHRISGGLSLGSSRFGRRIVSFAYGISMHSDISIAILLFPGICLILKHMENYRRVREGTEPTIRGYLKGLKSEKS